MGLCDSFERGQKPAQQKISNAGSCSRRRLRDALLHALIRYRVRASRVRCKHFANCGAERTPQDRRGAIPWKATDLIVLARIGCRIEGTPCLVASTISRQSWAISEAKTSEVYSRGAERWKLALGAMEKVSQALF
ncbi:hypothetical protein NXC24_CH02034 [Rhizobium sp. NXC24]|nr:hypothetical protein NXC24_CH02034 [Rhizobium sp. NXC24]